MQLSPRWKIDLDRLEAFLEAAPTEVRWAFEFRHPTWLQDAVFELLSKQKAALCVHDLIENHPTPITGDFLYYRFHGNSPRQNYPRSRLEKIAAKLREHCQSGRIGFVYFNNDVRGNAVRNAIDLRKLLIIAP